MRKQIVLIVILALALALLSGCGNNNSASYSQSNSSGLTVIDISGDSGSTDQMPRNAGLLDEFYEEPQNIHDDDFEAIETKNSVEANIYRDGEWLVIDVPESSDIRIEPGMFTNPYTSNWIEDLLSLSPDDIRNAPSGTVFARFLATSGSRLKKRTIFSKPRLPTVIEQVLEENGVNYVLKSTVNDLRNIGLIEEKELRIIEGDCSYLIDWNYLYDENGTFVESESNLSLTSSEIMLIGTWILDEDSADLEELIGNLDLIPISGNRFSGTEYNIRMQLPVSKEYKESITPTDFPLPDEAITYLLDFFHGNIEQYKWFNVDD